MLKSLYVRLHRFLAARFSPTAEMGLHFTIGIALILFAAFVFGEIAEDVVEGDKITLIDVQLAHWFRERATSGFTNFMLFVTNWNGIIGAGIMGALLALWFWYRKAHYWLMVVLIAVPGGMLLNVALKHVFRRARPTLEDPLLTLSTYSFPSGHTAAATVFYGLLACYLVRHVEGRPARAAIVAACAAMVGLVALSRMYLGVHYLSDVLAAAAEGSAWLMVCLAAVSVLKQRRIARRQGREAV